MSYPSPPDLSEAVNSGETIESHFSSNLMTPTDGDLYNGLESHERLTIAEAVSHYFDGTVDEVSFRTSVSLDPGRISKSLIDDLDALEVEEVVINEADTEPEIKGSHSLVSLNNVSYPSSSLSSSESFRRARSESIYNLPNDHIFIEAPLADTNSEQDGKDALHVRLSPRQICNEFEFNSLNALTDAVFDSFPDFFVLCIRILFFLPWCAAVGGALLFFPDYLDMIAFDTGYLDPVVAIRRFSHWATYGFQHIISFFAVLGALVWRYPNLGIAVAGVLLGQLYIAWHDFLFDPTIPLGKDARQMTYLLFTTSWLDSDYLIDIKKIEDDYYWAINRLPDESDADSD